MSKKKIKPAELVTSFGKALDKAGYIHQDKPIRTIKIESTSILQNVIRKLTECYQDLQLLPQWGMRVGGAMHNITQAIDLLKKVDVFVYKQEKKHEQTNTRRA